MEKINMSIIPRTVSISVAVKRSKVEEVLTEIESRLQSLNGSLFHHSDQPTCLFKKNAVVSALNCWVDENRIADGFILYILIRGRVVEVSARSLQYSNVAIGREGVNGELKTSESCSNIISYTY